MGYMAPEQLKGYSDSPEADIFVFGTILYELVTDQQAFDGQSAMEIAYKIMNRVLPSLDNVSPHFAGIIFACWQEDPALRPSPAAVRAMMMEVPTSALKRAGE